MAAAVVDGAELAARPGQLVLKRVKRDSKPLLDLDERVEIVAEQMFLAIGKRNRHGVYGHKVVSSEKKVAGTPRTRVPE